LIFETERVFQCVTFGFHPGSFPALNQFIFVREHYALPGTGLLAS